MLYVLLVYTQVQISLHVAYHQYDFDKKAKLVVIGYFVDIAQNIAYLSRQISNQQSS